MSTRQLALLLLLASAGCAALRGASGPAPCVPVSGPLPPGASLAPLAGRFIITLVSSGGGEVGGHLMLRPAPAGAPAPAAHARTAFIGTTDVRLESVGAQRLGDIGSEDPAAPGVAVYEQRSPSGAPTVTARVGSLITAAPPAGMMVIEGPYTVLFIRQVGRGGFAGGWTSSDGTPGAAEARGHFCATRLED